MVKLETQITDKALVEEIMNSRGKPQYHYIFSSFRFDNEEHTKHCEELDLMNLLEKKEGMSKVWLSTSTGLCMTYQ